MSEITDTLQKCLGLSGKIFGHSFENYLLEEKGVDGSEVLTSIDHFNGTIYAFKQMADKQIEVLKLGKGLTYQLRCKRCGIRPIDAFCQEN